MVLSKELLKDGKSSNGGYSLPQLKLLGIDNFHKGWLKSVINKDFPEKTITQFIELKNKHLKK